jgi:hypothetical protein
MVFDVFVSYSRQDKSTADAACSALEGAGIRCWIAPRDVAPGTDWAGSIVEAINHCRVMVMIFSSGSNQSRQIHREVERAFEREVPVIPFRIEDVKPESALAYYMGPVHWLDALSPPLENHLQSLITSVAALLQKSKSAEPRDGVEQMAKPQPAANIGHSASVAPPPERPSQSSAAKLLTAAMGGLVVAIAAAGLWLYGQRPNASAPKPTPSVTVQSNTPVAASSGTPVAAAGSTPATAPTPAPTPSAPSPSGAANCASAICGTWTGVGGAPPEQFGGAPFCTYSVSLQNATLTATVDASGNVTKAALSLTMAEGTVGSCPYPPLASQPHSYAGGGTTNGTNISLTLNPASANKPQASATFNGRVVNGRLAGTITVHRLDQRSILAWTVYFPTQ